MKIAIFGLDLGHPKIFAPLFRRHGVEIHSVVASPSDAVSAFAADNACPILTADELWQKAGEIDGLMVSNQTKDRHLVRRFLERGIPTFFDKHLGIDAAAAAQIKEAAQKGNAPVLAGSLFRFAPPFAAIASQAHQGSLGDPVLVEMFLPYPPAPGSWQDKKEACGGFLVNFGIHCIDPICTILGADFETVYCAGGRYVFQDAESLDTCVITIQFRNGSLGIATLFGAQDPFLTTQPSLRLHATKRSVEAFIDEGLLRNFRGTPLYDPATYSYCSGVESTVAAIVEMLRTRQQPVPWEEMLAVPQILDLACLSYQERQTVSRNSLPTGS